MFQLGARKAPGPASFFQKHWNWVGPSVLKFIKLVFSTGTVPESMNRSLICLLPKQSPLETIAQFRPICLSNVIMKVVTKIIANRIKPVLGELVGAE